MKLKANVHGRKLLWRTKYSSLTMSEHQYEIKSVKSLFYLFTQPVHEHLQHCLKSNVLFKSTKQIDWPLCYYIFITVTV